MTTGKLKLLNLKLYKEDENNIMKKLISMFVFILALSFASAQDRTYVVDFGPITNGVTVTSVTKYLKLDGWSKIDSVQITLGVDNETDIDSFDVYVGNAFGNRETDWDNGYYGSTVYHYEVTLNVAAAAQGRELLLISNASLLTTVVMRGVNALKFVTRGANSGNDPTDPNRLRAFVQVFGTKANP